MATVQQSAPQSTKTIEHRSLLDQILDRPDIDKRIRTGVAAALQQTDLIEEVLPPQLKGQGERFARRAALEFERNDNLQACSARSFIRCVVEAAELGLVIDGRLAHAVPYNCNTAKKSEPAKWETIATLILDYKGLIAIAKRSGQIRDCHGVAVYENDFFINRRDDGVTHFSFERAKMGSPRGKLMGYAAELLFADGTIRTDVMDVEEVAKIKARSKAKDKGPWVTDTDQMGIKTVIRRLLKLVCDDPAFMHACDVDDRDILGEAIIKTEKRVTRAPLQIPARDNGNGASHAEQPTESQLPAESHDGIDPAPPSDESQAEPDPEAAPFPADITDGFAKCVTLDNVNAMLEWAQENFQEHSERSSELAEQARQRIHKAQKPAKGAKAEQKSLVS